MIKDLVHCIVSKESVEQTENKDTDIQVRQYLHCYIVIQALGEQLKVRQQVIATATIYFKRFYAR